MQSIYHSQKIQQCLQNSKDAVYKVWNLVAIWNRQQNRIDLCIKIVIEDILTQIIYSNSVAGI